MLKRSFRLPAQISLHKARYVPSQSFSLKLMKNGLSISRFGFVISKRSAKTAVDRNASKRLVRQVIQENLANIVNGYDMLFILRNNLRDKTKEELNIEILSLFRKLFLLNEEGVKI